MAAYAALRRARIFLGIGRDFHAKNAGSAASDVCRGSQVRDASPHQVFGDYSHTTLLLN